jgi:hypothetical protein
MKINLKITLCVFFHMAYAIVQGYYSIQHIPQSISLLIQSNHEKENLLFLNFSQLLCI